MKMTPEEFIAYVRGIVDSEKQRMVYESNRLDRDLSQLISSESKLPRMRDAPPPPEAELHGPLKLIETALKEL